MKQALGRGDASASTLAMKAFVYGTLMCATGAAVVALGLGWYLDVRNVRAGAKGWEVMALQGWK